MVWQEKSLGDVCTLQRGFDLPTSQRMQGEFPLISSSGSIDFHSEAKVIGPGVVTGRSGSIGSVFFEEKNFWPLNTTLYVKDFHGNEPRFIFYLLNLLDLKRFATGMGVPTLNRNLVHVVRVSIPDSVPEQRRIVAVLDEAFEGLAIATANTEKNLKNAREVFEGYLDSVFTTMGDDWKVKPIGEIAEIKGGKRVPKGYALLSEPTEFPYLRVTDFNNSGSIDMDDLRYVDANVRKQIKNYIITEADLYVSIAGTIGKTGIVPFELRGANLTENACRLVFQPNINNRFVYYFTLTKSFVEQSGLNTRTAAQPKLALSRLATIQLGLPSFETQNLLAKRFDQLKEEISELENLYRQKLAAIAELKQSLLQKAFAGDLTKNFRPEVEAALA